MLTIAPAAYVPLGALEWHGEHNPLGVDGIKAHALCEAAAAISGGVVFPPVFYGSFGTMPFPFTFNHPAKSWKALMREIVVQLSGMGFKVIVLLSGHYPPAQIKFLRGLSRRANKTGKVLVLGAPEQHFALDLEYYGDHAGMWETSLMLAIRPELVRIEALPEGLGVIARKKLGVLGQDPRAKATAEKGREAMDLIAGNLSRTVTRSLAENSPAAIEEVFAGYDRALRLSPRLLHVARVALDVKYPWQLLRYLWPDRGDHLK
jgi:creatinine amidohydrolase